MISSLTNQGKLRFMIYEGALNTTIFLNFLRRLVREAARKLFVIVDNLPVHRATGSPPGSRTMPTRSNSSTCRPTRPSTIRTNSSTTISSRRWRVAARQGTRPRSSPA